MNERETPEWVRLVMILAYLAYLAGMVWAMLPEHRKQEIRMRLALLVRQSAGSGARQAAAASMEAELRTGHELYGLPYLLSKLRDAAGSIYERARP